MVPKPLLSASMPPRLRGPQQILAKKLHRRLKSQCTMPATSHSKGDANTTESTAGDPAIDVEELIADLQHFKEHTGNLAIPLSHPTCLRAIQKLAQAASHPSCFQVVDIMASAGMEELIRKRWDSQFVEVRSFEREHGDCLIPVAHPTLGEWARVQRDHYKLYKKRLPSPLTKKRFERLKDIGFDEFVTWDEKDEHSSETVTAEATNKGNIGTISGEANISGENLTFDEENAIKKISNPYHPVSNRGTKHRILRRSLPMGLGPSRSKRLITEIMEKEEEGKVDDEMPRSCSATNLCPGSWECGNCTYLNEVASFDLQTDISREICKICFERNTPRAPKERGLSRRLSRGPSLAREIASNNFDSSIGAPIKRGLSRGTSQDDIMINDTDYDTSWGDLGSALDTAAAVSLSFTELNVEQSQKNAMKRAQRKVSFTEFDVYRSQKNEMRRAQRKMGKRFSC